MKKSILALGALAVAGGLGLANTAQAVYYFGWGIGTIPGTAPALVPAEGLELNPGSTGHSLVVPYYSVNGGAVTLFSIVNTDVNNGKAVKVRFRGAANSDDVLDFTLFLSPADTWMGAITQDSNGLAHLTSHDKSCTLPAGPYDNLSGPDRSAAFHTERIPAYLGAAVQAANTREGYVEILNMADIPLRTLTTTGSTLNGLYTAIKHVGGVPPCAATWGGGGNMGLEAMGLMLNTDTETNAADLLNNYGLAAPSGGLTGGWIVLNQTSLAAFSGNDTAIRAYTGLPASGGNYPTINPAQPQPTLSSTANTWVAFSPQLAVTNTPVPFGQASGGGVISILPVDPVNGVAALQKGAVLPINALTADVALNTAGGVIPFWNDLPDLSTPLGIANPVFGTSLQGPNQWPAANPVSPGDMHWPTAHVDLLAHVLAKTQVNDEFMNDPTGATQGVTAHTDWIISEPTRRYFAVIRYGATAATAANGQLFNNNSWSGTSEGSTAALAPNPPRLPYAGLGTPLPAMNNTLNTAGAGILTSSTTNFGQQLCLIATGYSMRMYDNEESNGVGSMFSPNSAVPLCGEVATLTFGTSTSNAVSSVGATLTNSYVITPYTIGWGNLNLLSFGSGPSYGLPLIGYSAIGMVGSNQSYGVTYPFRY